MSILRFITHEQLDDLDEDPRIGFMQLVDHAQRSLDQQLSEFSSDEDGYYDRQSVERSFMNVIVASAKEMDVEPFNSIEIPEINSSSWSSEYPQFKADLDHYVTQIVLSNSRRNRKNSVRLSAQSRQKIHTYLNALRECVLKSDIDDKKQKILLVKIDEFEQELTKARIKLSQVMLWSIAILGLPNDAWGSADIVKKLVTNVVELVAQEKAIEKDMPLLQSKSQKALSPPRSYISKSKSEGGWNAEDLDDEVPF